MPAWCGEITEHRWAPSAGFPWVAAMRPARCEGRGSCDPGAGVLRPMRLEDLCDAEAGSRVRRSLPWLRDGAGAEESAGLRDGLHLQPGPPLSADVSAPAVRATRVELGLLGGLLGFLLLAYVHDGLITPVTANVVAGLGVIAIMAMTCRALLAADPLAIWTPLWWLRVAYAVYYGFGALVPYIVNDATLIYMQNIYLFTDEDILKVNLINVLALIALLLGTQIAALHFSRSRVPRQTDEEGSLQVLAVTFLLVGGFARYGLVDSIHLWVWRGLSAVLRYDAGADLSGRPHAARDHCLEARSCSPAARGGADRHRVAGRHSHVQQGRGARHDSVRAAGGLPSSPEPGAPGRRRRGRGGRLRAACSHDRLWARASHHSRVAACK